MGLRDGLASFAIKSARGFGRVLGCELCVELSDHSVDATMEVPGSSDGRAWDDSLYESGQVYVRNYANPIKAVVDTNTELENPDRIEVAADGGEVGGHVELISSSRYREYMRQDLISQLLNPRESWKLIMYILAGLSIVTTIMTIFVLLISNSVGVF